VLAVPTEHGQKWPKHVMATFLLTPIKLVTLDRLLVLVPVFRGVRVQGKALSVTGSGGL
jgi:hypothetical protein